MSIVTLHSMDDPLKQHGDIGKHLYVKNPSKVNAINRNTSILSTKTATIVKSDSASDTTTVADDENDIEIIHEEDYSFITGSSDITLAQEEVVIHGEHAIEDNVIKTSQHRPLPELPLPPSPSSSSMNDTGLPEKTTNEKINALKSRFKKAFRVPHQRRRRRHYVDVEEFHPPPKDNECAERYRRTMELPAPTCHLEHYHPAAAVPTLSYSVCGPGSKPVQYKEPTTANQFEDRPLPPIPPPKKLPKGILKKPPPLSPEEHVTAMMDRHSTSSLSSSSTASSSTTKTSINNKQLPESPISPVVEDTKRRSWLCKLRSTVAPSPGQSGKKNEKERKRTIRYNKMVIVHDTYTRYEYNREPDPNASCAYLTAEAAQDIKNELNMFKFNEMIVHPTSRIYTHFFI